MANLLCVERHNINDQFVLEVENCVESFLEWVRDLTILEDGDGEQMVIYAQHTIFKDMIAILC